MMPGRPLPVRRFNPPKIGQRFRSPEDAQAMRRAWLDLIADAGRTAERLEASDGEELLEPLDLAHALKTIDQHSYPAPGASAQGAAYAFLLQLRGVLEAGSARTRSVLAPALAASAKALATLLNDQAVTAAGVWKGKND
jgi:hypothetical protein